jgi:hypothetical protein
MRGDSRLSEYDVHAAVAARLDARGVMFFHPPNGTNVASHKTRGMLKRMGLKAGVPDIIIIDPPPAMPEMRGAALELKRTRGVATPAQKDWLTAFEARGWAAAVAKGLEASIAQLQEWGYLPRSGR